VGVPVEVVGRPSRGEGRVPGGAGVVEVGKGDVEVECVVLEGFRGVERLRKDIVMREPLMVDLQWGSMQEQDARRAVNGPRTLVNFWSVHCGDFFTRRP